MNRLTLSLLALLLVLSPALAAGRSGGSFGGRSMSRPSVTRSYSRPSVRLAPPRRPVTAPHITFRPQVRLSPSPARPVVVVVHQAHYSPAYPYLIGGAYWPHPQSWYPAGTVFPDGPTYIQPVPSRSGHAWVWLLVIAALIVLVVWLARRRA